MNLIKLKEALRGKITSREQLISIYRSCDGSDTPHYEGVTDGRDPFYFNYTDCVMGRPRWRETSMDSSWWWWREQMRIKLVYPSPSSVLKSLVDNMGLTQYCIHPSTDPETPYAVAYTPDQVMGENDRQLKVSSLAKLVKKLCILITDEHAQKLEAAHRAELDPSFELATTAEEIEYVYRNMEGDSGCMRYEGGERWSLPDGYHPSHVYAMPGMGVAYHKRNDRIVSRAVVFTTAEGTKHWVRIYGDGALKTKLERNGYTERALHGQKLRAIQLPAADWGEHYYMVPYIDGVGGRQSDGNGTYGIIDQADPDHIQLMSTERATKLMNVGVDVRQFKGHTSVSYHMPAADLSSLKATCPISGVVIDKTCDEFMTVWYNDQETAVLATADARRRFDVARSFYVGERWKTMRCSASLPMFEDTYYLPHAIERMGIKQLDERAYPGNRRYYRKSEFAEVNGRIYPRTDLVTVYYKDAEGFDAHKYILREDVTGRTQRAAFVKDGYHIVGSGDSLYLIHADHSDAVKLYNGKVVHGGRHTLVTLYDGTKALNNGAKTIRVLNREILVPRIESFELDRPAAFKKILGLDLDKIIFDINESMDRRVNDTFANRKAHLDTLRTTYPSRLYVRALSLLRASLPGSCTPVVQDGAIVPMRLSYHTTLTRAMVQAVIDAAAAGATVDSDIQLWIEAAQYFFGIVDAVDAHIVGLLEEIGAAQIAQQDQLAQLMAEAGLAPVAA